MNVMYARSFHFGRNSRFVFSERIGLKQKIQFHVFEESAWITGRSMRSKDVCVPCSRPNFHLEAAEITEATSGEYVSGVGASVGDDISNFLFTETGGEPVQDDDCPDG